MQLKDLQPGEMFRRDPGHYRYSVSNTRDENAGGTPIIYCYNHDGKSLGYFHLENEEVVRLIPPEVEEGTKEQKEEPASIFWMCYVKGGGAPGHQHFNYFEAVEETKRLALKTDKRVSLLQSICSVVYVKPITKEGFNWRTEC